MRRFAVVLALAVGLIAFPGLAAAAASGERVSGGGTLLFGGEKDTFNLHARHKADGSVSGSFVYHYRSEDESWWADLDCLVITGNVAQVGGVVTKVQGDVLPFIFVGTRVTWRVEDNGQGKAAAPDQIGDLLFHPTLATCQFNHPALNPYLDVSGNIQIED